MKVFKFGGASVKDADAFRNVLTVLNSYRNVELFIVISAMGKMTNAFEKLHEAYFKKTDILPAYEHIYNYHINVLDKLFPDQEHTIYKDLKLIFYELNAKLQTQPTDNYNFEYDQIVPYGELISSLVLSQYLNDNTFPNKLVDARDIIKTNNTYREARINWEMTPLLVSHQYKNALKDNCKIAVTQGFIGSCSENYTTTLGREGSDFTAAILGYSLNAEEVVIWKDVPGVLNADPKQFDETQKIDNLTYLDAIELAYYGATVIHPKTIKPLENAQIPLLVKSFINPEGTGTIIGNKFVSKKPIPSYIFKFNQILISILPKDFSFIAEQNLSVIFQIISHYNIKVNLMQNSAVSFSICTDYDSFKTPKLIAALKKDFKIYFNENLELVTIRHYNDETIKKVTKNKEIMLEQRSRNTVQIVLK